MASKHVLLIHGWSAKPASMAPVAALLAANGFDAVPLQLGGYPSLHDDVRVEDISRRLDTVIGKMQADGRLGGRFHVIVHSTGAFVARHWIAGLFEAGRKIPVENFLMLAPANHGSPLANFGRSALGRIAKFSAGRPFESGAELLHALELGSAWQEELDLRDRLSKTGATDGPYGAGGVRPYVIVGAQPMDAASILNENAWDGTVRIAGANFDPRGLTVDFTTDPRNPAITEWTARGAARTAFAVLPDRTHASILQPAITDSLSDDPAIAARLGGLILEALSVRTAAQYDRLCGRCQAVCEETRLLARNSAAGEAARERALARRGDRIASRYHEHYQVVLDVRDDTPRPVTDYFLWLTAPTEHEIDGGLRRTDTVSAAEIHAHRDVLRNVHVNDRAPHRRVLHLDRMELLRRGGFFDTLHHTRHHCFMAGITASATGSKIAFFDRDAREGTGFIPLRAEHPQGDYQAGDRFLRRYATHYIEIRVPRIADDDVFAVKPYRA